MTEEQWTVRYQANSMIERFTLDPENVDDVLYFVRRLRKITASEPHPSLPVLVTRVEL